MELPLPLRRGIYSALKTHWVPPLERRLVERTHSIIPSVPTQVLDTQCIDVVRIEYLDAISANAYICTLNAGTVLIPKKRTETDFAFIIPRAGTNAGMSCIEDLSPKPHLEVPPSLLRIVENHRQYLLNSTTRWPQLDMGPLLLGQALKFRQRGLQSEACRGREVNMRG